MGKMKKRVAFNTQLASIMEALAKAAVTEIRKIVEDDSVLLRLEVSRSHKEIDRLRRRLTEVESELRTALEAATRESRSVGVQVVDQFETARGAVMGGMDAPFVEQLSEKKCKAQTQDTRHDFGFAVKKEQEEESVDQILHQTESEHSAGRLNNVGSEYVTFEIDNPPWSAFTQGDGDVTDDLVCSSVTEQCSQSLSVLSPIRHTPASMEMCGNRLSNLGKDDYVVVGDVVKEEAGGQCLYTEESRSEVSDTQQTEHEQPPISTNDNLTSQAINPVQQQLDLLTGVTKRNTNPVSSSDQYISVNRRPVNASKYIHHRKRFIQFLEVSRSQKEIGCLRKKLQQAESELRTTQEAATRESRSVGVQAANQFEAADGAVKGGKDAAFAEHLKEKKCKAQTRDARPDFGFSVKEELEQEHVAQVLRQAESEPNAGRLNNVGSKDVIFERAISRSHKEIDWLRKKLQQVESELRTAQEAATRKSRSVGVQVVDQFDVMGGAVKGVKEEQEEEHMAQALRQTESEHSAGRLNNQTPTTMEMSGSTLSSLVKDDRVVDGGVVKEEAVSRSHKEIDWLRKKLQQVESELRTAQEAATRKSRSVGVQVVDQFDAIGGAVEGDTDVPFIEKLDEKNSGTQTCDTRSVFGSAVKEEQEEESVALILGQSESEDSAGRLNNVGSDHEMFESDHLSWRCFTLGDSDMTDDPDCANATEQFAESQSILSPKQHTKVTLVESGSTLSSLENDDHVADGGVVKEEAGGQCSYPEKSRSEMGDTLQMEHEQPSLSTNDNLTSQQFCQIKVVSDYSTGPVSSSDQNAGIPWRPVLRLEVSRSHKEIDWLRRKLQLVESELRTAQEAATRESRSDGAQIVDQSEAAGGAVQGDADATFVEQLGKNCKAQTCDARPDFGFAVKEEQEEQHAVQILHQTESEHSAGGLNEVDSETKLTEPVSSLIKTTY
ncbi:hypothetical protein GJAV_G00093700 [Gymnothorax javanicus]|nr:hypothetical protein GJAV_G00093700 [Gymnothorax javanicus]